MLSDTAIQRDSTKQNIVMRLVNKIKKRIAPSRRKKLDEYYRKTLESVSFSVLSNNCVGGGIPA